MNGEMFRILVVDDEEGFSLLLAEILGDEGYRVRTASSPDGGLKALERAEADLVITDLRMPGMDGISFMETARERFPGTDFIMITAHGTIESAVNAMKLGALDYITKPLKDPEEIRRLVRKAFERHRLEVENRALRDELSGGLPPADIVFAGLDQVLDEIKAVARTDTTVILFGETGTGKSLIARIIHQMSGRKGLLVTINCASIPENLLESELFGHEKGAFTGAVSSKKGKFELARDGTVFLDEIAEMSPALQAKLLRVLQEKRFERVGGLDTLTTNCRVIAATNRDLRVLVAEKKFREDLFFRLMVFPVHIPPLRARAAVIPRLTEFLVKKLSLKVGKPVREIPEESWRRLKAYQWPGNIRELENVIEKAIILSRDGVLLIPHLELPVEVPLGGDMKSIERQAIENALQKTNGSRKAAAEVLGISLRSLQYKIKEYRISG